MKICSIGTLNASMVNGREVFKSAILSNACSAICVHNHPSGSLNPSEEDKQVTAKLLECSRLLDIPIIESYHSRRGNRREFQLPPGRAAGAAQRERESMGTIEVMVCEHTQAIAAFHKIKS